MYWKLWTHFSPFLTLVCIISAEYHFKIPKGYFYDFWICIIYTFKIKSEYNIFNLKLSAISAFSRYTETECEHKQVNHQQMEECY